MEDTHSLANLFSFRRPPDTLSSVRNQQTWP